MRITKLLSFIFFLSGFASLLYQVVWQRLLTIYYGVGSISIALIVSIFMGGLGFGALIGGFVIERSKRRIFLYFLIEVLIGFFGLISLFFLGILGEATAGVSYGLSFLCMSAFLIVPTLLMGMTLPILIKIFNSFIGDFKRTVSYLYFINTIGAALGALTSTFVFISIFGLDGTVYIAVAINFLLALLIYSIQKKNTPLPGKKEASPVISDNKLGKVCYLLVFITGFLAIGYEIVWFRFIGVLVKASSYAFSSMLSIYLLGIALGSYFMGKYLLKRPLVNQKKLFFSIQFLIAIIVAFIFIAYYYLTKFTIIENFTRTSFQITAHPFPAVITSSGWSIFETITNNAYAMLDIFFWPILLIFVPTLLMGASFPLISSLALKRKDKEGQTVGLVYFFNVLGNVFGGIITGFVLLNYFGTGATLIIFICIGMAFGLFAQESSEKVNVKRTAVVVIAGLAIIIFPRGDKLFQLMHPPTLNETYERYLQEGRDGLIVTYEKGDSILNFINGLMHGGRPGIRYYRQALETIAHAQKLDDVLVVGLGTGSTVESYLKMYDVYRMTLVELNKTLLKNFGKITFFKGLLSDPRIEVVVDDGRRFLLGSEKTFDVIAIDPLRSSSAYSNNIYSREFFEIIKDHLNEKGIFFVWTDETSVMPKTVANVFPYVYFYKEKDGGFCIASRSPMKRDNRRMAQFMNTFSAKYREYIIADYPMLVADRELILKRAKEYPINTDFKPYSEYYLGLILKHKMVKRRLIQSGKSAY